MKIAHYYLVATRLFAFREGCRSQSQSWIGSTQLEKVATPHEKCKIGIEVARDPHVFFTGPIWRPQAIIIPDKHGNDFDGADNWTAAIYNRRHDLTSLMLLGQYDVMIT